MCFSIYVEDENVKTADTVIGRQLLVWHNSFSYGSYKWTNKSQIYLVCTKKWTIRTLNYSSIPNIDANLANFRYW